MRGTETPKYLPQLMNGLCKCPCFCPTSEKQVCQPLLLATADRTTGGPQTQAVNFCLLSNTQDQLDMKGGAGLSASLSQEWELEMAYLPDQHPVETASHALNIQNKRREYSVSAVGGCSLPSILKDLNLLTSHSPSLSQFQSLPASKHFTAGVSRVYKGGYCAYTGASMTSQLLLVLNRTIHLFQL